ncbi:hypothetical protein [Nocardioides sp.]
MSVSGGTALAHLAPSRPVAVLMWLLGALVLPVPFVIATMSSR